MKNKFPYKKTLLIDLDGVLNNYCGNYDENHIPEVKEGAKKFLDSLCEKFNLVLFTTREHSSAEKWLRENNLDRYFSKITNEKLPAFLQIDDRAICFSGDYDSTLQCIEKFNPHWKSESLQN